MLKQSREPITDEEARRLDRLEKQGFFRRLLAKPSQPSKQPSERFVEAYRVSVERCFIPLDFNEELPLYFLDVGQNILILFGQWLFDPHVLIVPANTFEDWDCDKSFFADFSLRCFREHDMVFELSVKSDSFVQAQRLNSRLKFAFLREWQLLPGSGETLISDLQNAGLIER